MPNVHVSTCAAALPTRFLMTALTTLYVHRNQSLRLFLQGTTQNLTTLCFIENQGGQASEPPQWYPGWACAKVECELSLFELEMHTYSTPLLVQVNAPSHTQNGGDIEQVQEGVSACASWAD